MVFQVFSPPTLYADGTTRAVIQACNESDATIANKVVRFNMLVVKGT